MQQITLHRMRFHAVIGILPHERVSTQPIEIDLTVTLGEGGDLVDYRALYAIVSGIMASGPIDFLEEAGERIARQTLSGHTRVRRARVAVRKPHVALGGPLEYAEVVTELCADD